MRDDQVGEARGELEGANADSPESLASGESAGDVIDRYELLEEIGEGGMGTVWRASQSEPVVRDVAFKVIKLGMDTREVVVRFEAERQALALMDHPNIAKVLDGGATKGGRPYFVMELVAGRPITEFCDERKLGLRARLELFTRVCEAVQHAHQKGVIHRDIKPSNVLVTEVDGAATPKVIDFGIAKATSAELTQKTLFTQYAQLIGTPEYMAPEQAEMGGDVDTRADVYSLGVLLYELLTGTKPFDIREVLAAGYDELIRTIREVDPAKPSTRVSSLGLAGSSIADTRHVNVETLRKRLRGDLDWIVMKALEKDRARRYETASGFALDIERFLRDETVIAAPPSAGYRMRKFVRRRRKTVAAIGAFALLLVAGSVGTSIGWWRTARANERLDVALSDKQDALSRETAERERAEANERRARDAEAEAIEEAGRANAAEADALDRLAELGLVTAFQGEQLRIDPQVMGSRIRSALLAAADGERRPALEASLDGVSFTSLATTVLRENFLTQTLDAVDGQFADQPAVQGLLLHTVAETLYHLGLGDQALDPLERAIELLEGEFGPHADQVLVARTNLGAILRETGDFAAAEAVLRDHAVRLARVLGEDHRRAIACRINLGQVVADRGRFDEAEQILRAGLADCETAGLGEGHDALAAWNGLASIHAARGDLAEGERAYRELAGLTAEALGPEHPHTLTTRSNLGAVLVERGAYEEAGRILEAVLEDQRRVLGDEHSSTLATLAEVADVDVKQGRFREGAAAYRSVLETFRSLWGEEHPDTLAVMSGLGVALVELGEFEEAEELIRRCVEIQEDVLGEEHLDTLTSRNSLGTLLQRMGEHREADSILRDVLDARRELLGDDHPTTLNTINSLGILNQERGRSSRAEAYFAEALEGKREILGDEHPETLLAMNNLAVVLQDRGKLDEAESLFREVLEVRGRELGDDHPSTLGTLGNYAGLVQELGRFDEALELRERSLAGLRRTLGDDHPDTLAAYNNLGTLLVDLERHDEAEEAYRRALEGMRRVYGDGHFATLNAHGNLGALFQSLGRPADAKPHYRELAFGFLGQGLDHSSTVTAIMTYGGLLDELGDHTDAVEIYQAWVDAARELDDPARVASGLANLGDSLYFSGEFAAAESALLESLEIRVDLFSDDDWRLANLRSGIAASRGAQGRFTEAAEAMVEATEALLSSPVLTAPGGQPWGRRAGERAIAFFAAWHLADPDAGHDAESAAWRERLDAWTAALP